MYIVKTMEQYNDCNVIFCEPIKNNIMVDGNFIRILYSTNHMILNGIYLLMNLTEITCEKYYNKYKCVFNIVKNKDFIDKIKSIEEDILKKYKTSKTPSYKIYEQVKYGSIKVFNDIGNNRQCSFLLKISGIWETSTNYGLTYKFCYIT